MRVSVCLGAILIPEYLDFHSGYSTPRSRIAGIYSGIYSGLNSYSGISQTNAPLVYTKGGLNPMYGHAAQWLAWPFLWYRFIVTIIGWTFIFVDFQALSEVERECQKLRKKLQYEVRITIVLCSRNKKISLQDVVMLVRFMRDVAKMKNLCAWKIGRSLMLQVWTLGFRFQSKMCGVWGHSYMYTCISQPASLRCSKYWYRWERMHRWKRYFPPNPSW